MTEQVTPATDAECTCEDVRVLKACPVHAPRDTTPADDAFVSAWLADLEPYEDHEREHDVKARDIRSLLYRIDADRAEIAALGAEVGALRQDSIVDFRLNRTLQDQVTTLSAENASLRERLQVAVRIKPLAWNSSGGKHRQATTRLA